METRTKAQLLKWRTTRLAKRAKNTFFPTSPSSPQPLHEDILDQILSRFDDESVFVHVGLSDIKTVFRRNPYEFLLETLEDNFENIIAPGFTPSFRSSGIYHKKFSRPEYGMFAKLFFDDADYRSDDAIHSILVRGNPRFDHCDHRDSFGESSCWAEFDRENLLILNIGTDEFLTTQLHYIEVENNLPYVTVPSHDGVIYFDEKDYQEITQQNYEYRYDFPVSTIPNWKKLRKYLTSTGSIQDHSKKGVNIYAFRSRDIRKDIEDKLKDDPYYIIT